MAVDPHRPIMMAEVLHYLRPIPGEVAVDCTLGGGGHARALLDRLAPGGRLIALDVDPLELPRAERRLRAAGFGPECVAAHQANFRDLPTVLAAEHVDAADMVLVDLGVSSMQHDTPSRGFSHKHPGPLDLRMDPTTGVPAWQRVANLDEAALAEILTAHADEPHAALIARLIAERRPRTTHALERLVWLGVSEACPAVAKADLKMSVRRTFQALRILVNDELASLDALLTVLPSCLRAGGRVVFLTFHSGEDRRVKKAFQAGHRAGIYVDVAEKVVRSARDETFANRRAASAKLRWAVRSRH
jgi:16S rRNA (cytosine1402-N4)-methyltransferase